MSESVPPTQQPAGQESGVRRVRTTEGARFFGVPVGEVIGNKFDSRERAATRATSMTRILSLQRQFAAARDTGNLGAMRQLQEKFSAAVKSYAATNGQLTDVLDSLVGARGRNDLALGKKKNLRD